MSSHLVSRFTALAAVLALLPNAAQAQSLAYGDVSGDSADSAGDASAPQGNTRTPRVKLTPYIEAQQVVFAELKPGNEVVTYSVIAAGVDAAIRGRNNEGSVSVRYERRFGWGNNAQDSDAISGVARFSSAVIPNTLSIEAGALAARNSIENNGAALNNGLNFGDSVTQIYSVYAGPSLRTNVDDVQVSGSYRLGYSRVESPKAIPAAAGQPAIDLFDESVVHSAAIRAGTRPGDYLPVGVGVGAGYNREDVSNLDQRVEDLHVRGDVTVPVGNDLSLVGGVGWEKVEVSSRDAVRDPVTGAPVVGSDGRYVTDGTAPRVLAYQSEGLIWDAGVMWRPSRRTALEAHVGRRYGSMTYYGSFAYAPSARTSLNISVYDTVSGFGGQLNNALANLPTQFQTQRNPFSGNVGGCVQAEGSVAAGQGTCLNSALGGVRSAVFRSRGVSGSVAINAGRLSYGVAAGYDQRKFIAAPGTALAAANGVIDENVWLAAFLSGRIDRNSSFSTNAYANWYQSGDPLLGDTRGLGATAAYYRNITSKLSATAAVGVDGVTRENLVDIWSAQALVGVRYSF